MRCRGLGTWIRSHETRRLHIRQCACRIARIQRAALIQGVTRIWRAIVSRELALSGSHPYPGITRIGMSLAAKVLPVVRLTGWLKVSTEVSAETVLENNIREVFPAGGMVDDPVAGTGVPIGMDLSALPHTPMFAEMSKLPHPCRESRYRSCNGSINRACPRYNQGGFVRGIHFELPGILLLPQGKPLNYRRSFAPHCNSYETHTNSFPGFLSHPVLTFNVCEVCVKHERLPAGAKLYEKN